MNLISEWQDDSISSLSHSKILGTSRDFNLWLRPVYYIKDESYEKKEDKIVWQFVINFIS